MTLDIDLHKRFGNFELNVALQAECGRLGVFGRSGSGKSTLALLLAGLATPDRGSINLDGETLYCSTRHLSIPPERRRIAVVFQQAHLFPHLSVEENLLYGYRRTSAAARRIDPQELSQVLELGPLLQRGVATLSGGERQRLSLGRALLACPRLLIMDEPLSALDEGLKHQIMPYLLAVFARFSIPFILISHAMNELRLMTDEVVVLHHGQVSARTTPEQLARERMGWNRAGYINLLRLADPEMDGDLYAYRFGAARLLMWSGGAGEAVFELSSKDIMLFKGRPEAISARNLLRCTVLSIFELENRIGVELACGGEKLIATVVRQAASELEIRVGEEIYAVIKASAFRRLF